MPSNLPSSFASAAAGQNARGGRSDGRGAVGGDWSRRDGRSANGTLTFRRSSTTPLSHSSQPPPAADNAVQHPGIDESGAQSSNYDLGPARYTKDDLLDMFRPQNANDDPSRLFISGWDPTQVHDSGARGWGKATDNHVPQEPSACWDPSGDSMPMGLHDLSAEEKEVFSTEINSPLKPPTLNKEGHPGPVNGRKASISHGAGNTFGVGSPSSATRPGTRRRETLESNPFSAGGLASPTAAGRFSRDDPSYWFSRKGSEMKDAEPEDNDTEQSTRDASSKLPFGNLMRSNTSGSIGMGSGWPPSNPTTPGGGAFGSFTMPNSSAVGDKRGGATAGGSRLAHLIPKDDSDNAGGRPEGQSAMNQSSWRSRPRTDTDPFADDELSGSAVLGGAQDTSSTGGPQQAVRAGGLGTPVKGSTGDFGMSGLNLGGQSGDNGPVSPSETNPYRSPPDSRHDRNDGDTGARDKSHGSNALHDQPSNFSTLPRGFGGAAFDGSDRSQTSSVGAKPYPLGGGMPGWPAPGGPSAGTPDRERTNFGNAFGNSLFGGMGDLQSPGMSNLNNVFGASGAGGLGGGSIGRGSKLGSLFPPAMQAQMQSHEHDNSSLADSVPDVRQSNPLGAIGRGNFSVPTRDTESPMRSNRGVFEELFPSSDSGRSHGGFSGAEAGNNAAVAPQSFTPVSGGLPFAPGQMAPGPEPPASQVRQMVMPDRMRWVYLDPQGQVQGPFTGLEMNDWYKANFFTPDLRVKKVEDPEFEPLGQLIRRIGNSREPFLVPQIGIPHGAPSQSGPFPPSNNSGVVPPLSGVFPSFGRTLTAEEQNNLERRKQEEQYLMAQQRDYVMRQQAMPKFPMQGPGLQHHSSAQSLQSQPSFGSMTSPIAMSQQQLQQQQQQQHQQHQHQQHQQPIGAMPPAFLDGSAGPQGNGRAAGSGNGELFRPDGLGNLSAAELQILASMGSLDNEPEANHQLGGQPGDAGLRSGLPDTGSLSDDPEGFRERLKEFEGLRAQRDAEQAAQAEESQVSAIVGDASLSSSAVAAIAAASATQPTQPPASSSKSSRAARKKAAEDALSLTQQVQQTQAAAAAATEPVEPGMPMPFPPPSSTTPLPAPTAQRVRSNLPEQYSRSQSGTPDTTQPPPLAPWAKDPGHEGQKGPSLKEIQEAEARKAAKAEEAAAAMRKAIMEQEAVMVREREKAVAAAAAAGLPATSTWGHGSPVSAASPWTKPGPTKGPAPGLPSITPSASKKTLAEIQREEELRKQKAKDVHTPAAPTGSVSKSYANLAGKPGQGPVPTAQSPAAAAAAIASGWAMVGAGGKVKVPIGPASQSRSASTSSMKPVVAAAPAPAKPSPKPSAMSISNGRSESANAAIDEFNKWTYRELSRGITGVNDIMSFQSALNILPLDTGLIADAVYANSTTMDGRHFAEEFVRRKRLAEKGVVERQPPAETKPGNPSGGWNEVAKKTSSTQVRETSSEGVMQGAGFKVVPSRKKGKK